MGVKQNKHTTQPNIHVLGRVSNDSNSNNNAIPSNTFKDSLINFFWHRNYLANYSQRFQSFNHCFTVINEKFSLWWLCNYFVIHILYGKKTKQIMTSKENMPWNFISLSILGDPHRYQRLEYTFHEHECSLQSCVILHTNKTSKVSYLYAKLWKRCIISDTGHCCKPYSCMQV